MFSALVFGIVLSLLIVVSHGWIRASVVLDVRGDASFQRV